MNFETSSDVNNSSRIDFWRVYFFPAPPCLQPKYLLSEEYSWQDWRSKLTKSWVNFDRNRITSWRRKSFWYNFRDPKNRIRIISIIVNTERFWPSEGQIKKSYQKVFFFSKHFALIHLTNWEDSETFWKKKHLFLHLVSSLSFFISPWCLDLLFHLLFSLLFSDSHGIYQTSDSINEERSCSMIHWIKKELSICLFLK